MPCVYADDVKFLCATNTRRSGCTRTCAFYTMGLEHHTMSDDGVRVMASARDVVLHEWSLRRPVQLDTSGGWHKCSRQTCDIIHLREYVCIAHQHVVAGPRCNVHDSACVLVNDLYVCQQVGCAHTCNQRTCHTISGRCSISGSVSYTHLRAHET